MHNIVWFFIGHTHTHGTWKWMKAVVFGKGLYGKWSSGLYWPLPFLVKIFVEMWHMKNDHKRVMCWVLMWQIMMMNGEFIIGTKINIYFFLWELGFIV